MPQPRELPPGVVIAYPNREKAMSKLVKLIVTVLMLVSVALMLAVTFGGWSKLQGLVPIDFAWAIAYVLIAFFIFARWARGLLPIAAALAILLLIIAVIAGLGGSGTSWFQRNHVDYASAQSIFGGTGLSADTLGALVLLIIPVQVLLLLFTIQGMAQGWNVEVERRTGDDGRRRDRTNAGPDAPGAPAPA